MKGKIVIKRSAKDMGMKGWQRNDMNMEIGGKGKTKNRAIIVFFNA